MPCTKAFPASSARARRPARSDAVTVALAFKHQVHLLTGVGAEVVQGRARGTPAELLRELGRDEGLEDGADERPVPLERLRVETGQ